ncbi:GatB/YqeY domain-containing protein [Paracoccaceae bacterium]|nr:GatB/YqeY domain-containing protein [Paracoccaceae bacterium]MDE2692786.1 GatB/YqeY domain-containing protein [Paracoccaceae bacterium]
MREIINEAVKDAMRSKDKLRLSTLRLINAAIKDKDIALRVEDRPDGVSSSEILQILGKMVKQRQESARAYEEGGRLELAEQELSEIKIVEEFLPRQLSDDDVANAIQKIISSVGATSIRDMGKVMASLKEKYTGQMDFGKAGATIKKILG